ncbi:hypothetical protein UlMin_005130 [Ulmus minor]
MISELKSLFSIIKTKRTAAFVYGFLFAFVAFTVFLAFSPSSNSDSPWFSNIFTTTIPSSSSDSSRSQFPSFFNFFFPNSSSSSSQQVSSFASSPKSPPVLPQTNVSRSSNSTFVPPTVNIDKPSSENQTQTTLNSNKPEVSKSNQTNLPSSDATNSVNVKNQTQISENSEKNRIPQLNRTSIAPPTAPAPANNSVSLTKSNSGKNEKNVSPANNSVSPTKSDSGKNEKNVSPANHSVSPKKSDSGKNEKSPASNYNQSNGTNSGVSAAKSEDDVVGSLMNCELFDGEWVKDDSYPLYKPGSCSFIDEQFNCILNGRPDKDYHKYKWKPKGCDLPRLDGKRMLEMLRGKRLVFVGDSLNRNMWESLVCILRNSAKDKSRVFEAQGRHHFRGEASYSFVFKDYDFTVEFFVSPFLVQEWEMPEKNGSKKETLRLDLVGRSSDQYKSADIIVFNTGHWWTHDKTSKGKDYYQEGSHVYGELNVLEAFRKALTTWARWVDANVNPHKSFVFFRGYSASHFSGGQWNSGGQCDSETIPIKNETYLMPYPPKMLVLEKVLRGMKTRVSYLNITRMTDFRKDGHPSIYRKQRLSAEERRSPLRFQDCSHWCLPGVPDAWNEVLYAELLVKYHQRKQQQQQQKKT